MGDSTFENHELHMKTLKSTWDVGFTESQRGCVLYYHSAMPIDAKNFQD